MEKNSIDIIIKSSLEDFEVECTPKDWAFMEDMLDAEVTTPLDNATKSQLQNMEVPLDATAWSAMAMALDDLELAGIDEAAKSALENFETPYKPTDWSIMGAMLDAEMPNGIDEMARTALNNYTVPIAPFDWAMMDMQLDDAGFPHEIDDAAKAALNQYETTRSIDWAAMESSLVEAEEVRRQLIITKSIEVFLFVFAIWTIGNFLPFHHESSDTIIHAVENIENSVEQQQPQVNNSINIDQLSIIGNTDNNSEVNHGNNITDINTANSGQIEVSTATIIESPVIQAITASEPSNIISNESSIEKIMNPAVENIFEHPINTIIPNEPTTTETGKPLAIVPTKSLKNQYVSPPNKKGGVFKLKSQETSVRANALADATYIDKKQFALNLEEELPTTSIADKYKYKPLKLKLVVSPQSSVFSKNTDKHVVTSGFATGLGLDYAISEKVEVSSGFAYNKKSYTHQEQEAFYGSNDLNTLNTIWDVEMDLIQVPVRMNYNIKNNEKTRLYAIGGATAGIIMKIANYSRDVSLTNVQGSLRSANAADDNSGIPESGLFQNGEISTSSFVTADIGLGLEYKTNRRFTFFIEPLFQRSIKKIGVDDETYQNYALSLGSRIIL